MSNAVVHIDGPFTSETAKIAGRRSGEVRRAMRRMTEAEVFSLIGDLRTLEDARRQLAALNILGLTGRITGTAQQGAVKAIELFVALVRDERGRVIEEQRTVIDEQGAEIRRLRDELGLRDELRV